MVWSPWHAELMGGLSKRRRRGALVVTVAAVMVVLAFGLDGCGGSGPTKHGKTLESPQEFLDRLDAAVRKGDTDFRVARLHPAVIARYGEDQCRTFLAGKQDKT